MTRRIVVSDTKAADPGVIEETFESAGVDVAIEVSDAKAPGEVIEAAAGADALVVDARTQVTAEVLAELDSLDVVGRAGIGVDNVAVEAAADHDVVVVNVPDYCVEEVSTHALALLLACIRRVPAYDRSVREGEWDWTLGRPIRRLAGRTVGLFAFGKIARRFAAKLRGFDVDVIAYDPHVPDYRMADLDVERVDFEDVLAADVVSIHAPLTDETRGVFDADAFDRMDDAILLNTARGPIVEEDALLAALESGRVEAAGLDVREAEPPGDSALHARNDVVLTPHVAWYSEASRADLGRSVARDVARVLQGGEPRGRIDPGSGWY